MSSTIILSCLYYERNLGILRTENQVKYTAVQGTWAFFVQAIVPYAPISGPRVTEATLTLQNKKDFQ